MPRDLRAEIEASKTQYAAQDDAQIGTTSTGTADGEHASATDERSKDDNDLERAGKSMALVKTEDQPPVKVYVQSLTELDVDSCLVLEEATFPPNERCTRDKVRRFIKLSFSESSFCRFLNIPTAQLGSMPCHSVR